MKRIAVLLLTVAAALTSGCSVSPFFDGRETGSDVICDQLFTTEEDNKEFLMYRLNDEYYEATEPFNLIEFEPWLEPIDIKNGEFAVMYADARLLNGGIAGYCDKPEIQKINSQEKLSPEQAVERCGIPDAADPELQRGCLIMKYEQGGDLLILFRNIPNDRDSYEMYRNGEYAGVVEGLLETDDVPGLIEKAAEQ